MIRSHWTPSRMMGLPRVSGTALSRDGRTAAFTVTVAEPDPGGGRFVASLRIVPLEGPESIRISPPGLSCTDPAFSPSGEHVAFLGASPGPGCKQVWMTPVGEPSPVRITDAPGGVTMFRWSPDGRVLAYAAADELVRGGPEVAGSGLPFARLFIADTQRSPRGRGNDTSLTPGRLHVTSFHWSPDGTKIVFAHQESPSPDAITTSDIAVVEVNGGNVSPLVSLPGIDTSPLYSPDGRWIAFVSDGGESHWAHLLDVYIIPAAGGTTRKLAETPDRYLTLLAWDADARRVFVQELDRTTSRIYALPIDGSPAHAVTGGGGTYSAPAVSENGEMLCIVHETCESPAEVYTGRVHDWNPSRLTGTGAALEGLAYARTEVVRWSSGAGEEIEGLLTYPHDYREGERVPLIVQLHGGPASAFQQWCTGAPSVYPVQAFAQAGFAMLCPNPRGSTGYGRTFRFANLRDWGGGDVQDILAGVDDLIRRGIADPERLGVCGWSYGGYLTAAIIAATRRFKAASVGAGIVHLASFAGTTDIPGYVSDYFGGEFWEQGERYAQRSPLLSAAAIATPTQILHGGADVRVPPSQGQELYTALKRRGIPTEFIVYPGMPHGAAEPHTIVDIGTRILGWFKAYISTNLRRPE